MKLSTAGLLIALDLTLVAVKPLAAHHSFDAEYDSKKPITVSGIVTKLDWVNPHAFVYIDTKDESGAVKHFKIEMGPPYALVRGGWKRDTHGIFRSRGRWNAIVGATGRAEHGFLQANRHGGLVSVHAVSKPAECAP